MRFGSGYYVVSSEFPRNTDDVTKVLPNGGSWHGRSTIKYGGRIGADEMQLFEYSPQNLRHRRVDRLCV